MGWGPAGKFGDGKSAGPFHLFVDFGRAAVQSTAKDEGETQNVINLIWIIAAPGSDDRIGLNRTCVFGADFGFGIRHGKDYRAGCHPGDHFFAQCARNGEAQEDVRTFNGFPQSSSVGSCCVSAFVLIQIVAFCVNYTFTVAHDDIVFLRAKTAQKVEARQRSGSRSICYNSNLFKLLTNHLQRIQNASGADNCSAVLIIVKNRYRHPFFECLFDDKALWRLDVLQVYTSN